MKFDLNRFIPKSDKAFFSQDMLLNDYEVVKQKFINKYMHQHLDQKREALQIAMNSFPTIKGFLTQLAQNLKTFSPHLEDETALCEELITRLPTNLAALVYISNNHESLDDILNYAEILDSNKGSLSRPDANATRTLDLRPIQPTSSAASSTASAASDSTESFLRKRLQKPKAGTATKVSRTTKRI